MRIYDGDAYFARIILEGKITQIGFSLSRLRIWNNLCTFYVLLYSFWAAADVWLLGWTSYSTYVSVFFLAAGITGKFYCMYKKDILLTKINGLVDEVNNISKHIDYLGYVIDE